MPVHGLPLRAWCRLPVPNMIADLDQAPKERVEKPVWRVAFFGRLEERKGIKLFVDAVQVLLRTCQPHFTCTLQLCCDGVGGYYLFTPRQ